MIYIYMYISFIMWYDSMDFLNSVKKPLDTISTIDLVENEEEIEEIPKTSERPHKSESNQERLISLACGYLSKYEEDYTAAMARVLSQRLKKFKPEKGLQI